MSGVLLCGGVLMRTRLGPPRLALIIEVSMNCYLVFDSRRSHEGVPLHVIVNALARVVWQCYDI